MAFSGGTGAVVTRLVIPQGTRRTSIVATFDGPLVPSTAQDPANYQVNAAVTGDPEFITSTGPAKPIVSARYDASTNQVTLQLSKPLAANQFYRVKINADPDGGVKDSLTTTTNGVTAVTEQAIDGDADDTPAGDFYGLVAVGTDLSFQDSDGDDASIRIAGGGRFQMFRQINGDVIQVAVVGGTTSRSSITGSVRSGKGSDGQVVLGGGLIPGPQSVTNKLAPNRFVLQATTTNSPPPLVATSQNLPFSLQLDPLSLPSVPAIQSAVSAQSGGKWLVFGGRTNGLHGFQADGRQTFPPLFQNNDIFVIDPATGQTWTESWAATGLPESTWASLASTNQEFYQRGDRLYTVGGYSSTGAGADFRFRTHDTLSSISVGGLIQAVINQGSAVSSVRQIRDPRFRVTGGDMSTIGNRTYLVFGQDFQGGYDGTTGTASISQVYTDEIRSFRIVDDGTNLAIRNYKAQRDPVNFRRRDGNLAEVTLPDGKMGLQYLGGVFTVPAGGGYVNPVVIGPDGIGRVDSYQQYFSQYSSPSATLYDSKDRSLQTILFGGISLYDYDLATGILSQNPGLPFVDDVTTLVDRADGSRREFIMPSQFPGLYGAVASYLAAPGLPTQSNGVIKLRDLKGPTTIGYVYGGILSTLPNTTNQATQTTASSQVFRVTLIPN